MIDPYKITDFNRTTPQLEEFLIFCIMVAGKNAKSIAKITDSFLFDNEYADQGYSPFEIITRMISNNKLDHYMKRSRTGKYRLLTKAFNYLHSSTIDLRTCSVDELEKIPGVGRKTSRFFVVHSRPNQKYAVLDTHVVKWLTHIGYEETRLFPKNYLDLEQIFIREAELRIMTVADLDLKIWSRFSSRNLTNIVIPFPNMKLKGSVYDIV